MKKQSSATPDQNSYKPVKINGHEYPTDPASESFTDLIMDCFQRGRDAAALNQRQKSLATLISACMPELAEKLAAAGGKTASAEPTKARHPRAVVPIPRRFKAQPKLKHA